MRILALKYRILGRNFKGKINKIVSIVLSPLSKICSRFSENCNFLFLSFYVTYYVVVMKLRKMSLTEDVTK